MTGPSIRAKVAPTRARTFRPPDVPPIVHALGGSIGSALALLLFYPLERARIEMQSNAADTSSIPSSESSSSSQQHALIDGDENLAISPIRDNVDEDNSWDRGSPVSPSSWSLNSRSAEENSEGSSCCGGDLDTNDTNSIVRCLIDLKERGVLYKGVKPIISTIFTSQFVFFFLHAYTKRWLARISPTSTKLSSPWMSLVSSCLAGIGNVLLTNPLWVTNMAIVSGATETQNLFRECLRLWKTRGPSQLWNGTDASLLLVSNPIIQFVCYEQFKRVVLASKVKRTQQSGRSRASLNPNVALSAVEAFLIAALAKAIATVGTYPLQLTQTLLRLSNSKDQPSESGDQEDKNSCDDSEDTTTQAEVTRRKQQQYKGTIDCLIQLYTTNNAGCAAWFTGMKAKLLQTVLTAAFTFLTYEQILGVVQRVVLHTVRMRQSRITGTRSKKRVYQ